MKYIKKGRKRRKDVTEENRGGKETSRVLTAIKGGARGRVGMGGWGVGLRPEAPYG